MSTKKPSENCLTPSFPRLNLNISLDSSNNTETPRPSSGRQTRKSTKKTTTRRSQTAKSSRSSKSNSKSNHKSSKSTSKKTSPRNSTKINKKLFETCTVNARVSGDCIHASQRNISSALRKFDVGTGYTEESKPDKFDYTEPHFELDGSHSYGCALEYNAVKIKHKNFIPELKKLKEEGGKSIGLYERWRIMQYTLNIVMKRFLTNHGVNASVLPPCLSYDMWRNETWRNLYTEVLDTGLDEDPCPDCDVRFYQDWDEENKFTFKIAPSSILQPSRWKKRRFLNTILVIGLPQHITIVSCREHPDEVVFEFFDPAGPEGDRRAVKAVKKWAETYLADKFSSGVGSRNYQKPVIFNAITKSVNFQDDRRDVMCQTWIWYWVYFRVIRQADAKEIIDHVKWKISQRQSLEHVQKFNGWLSELFKLGYVVYENQSEAEAAAKSTPPDIETLKKIKKRQDRYLTDSWSDMDWSGKFVLNDKKTKTTRKKSKAK